MLRAGPDQSVTLSLVLTNGYLVDPNHPAATIKIYPPRPAGMAVAIHDSGWSKLLGLSSTNWNYFVMPESVKEALCSDGTPYVVVSDLDIANGVLTNANGTPKYPILISLAAEAIRDEEITPLTNYVAAGGFVLAGSSSFTRTTNGGYRTNFALASQMGLSCSPSAANWFADTYFVKQADHRLVSHIPGGPLVWRMPTSSEEINWGTCQEHVTACGCFGPHDIWQVATNAGVQVLAWGDSLSLPYLTVNQYETNHGAKGDYYLCTGAANNDPAIIAALQQATNSGATIAPHNGGKENPRASDLLAQGCVFPYGELQYEYWH